MVAVELYRVMKEAEELKKKLEGLRPDSPKREELQERLRETGAEQARLKKMMEGAKET